MSLFTTVTRRPVAVFVLFTVLIVFSLYTGSQIPLSFQPQIGTSEVSVRTQYPGANAELIEDTITKPLERVFYALDNVKRIVSQTTEGHSIIWVRFKYKSGMDKNLDNVRIALDSMADSFPDGAGKPQVQQWSGSNDPVIFLNVSANRNHNELREYIEDVITPYFDQINGVAYYEINGGVKKSVNIDISLNRLNAYNLTLGEVEKTIKANGFGQTLGSIETKYKNIGVVLDGDYKNIEAIRNIIVYERKINNTQSAYIRLRDIADVSFTYGEEATQVFQEGKPSVRIIFFKQNDANLVEVARNIKNELKRLDSISPRDIDFTIGYDFSNLTGGMYDSVISMAFSGAIIALCVLIIFLRNFASVVIVGCSIPISIILTLLFLYLKGYSLNFMTLTGLAMGIGIIVDNSIVVLENIYIKRKNKVNLLPAAEYGAAEMAVPVLASTATTVLVFLPLIIFEQQLGEVATYFILLGFTVIIAIIVSYFTAILLVPVLASKFIPLNIHGNKGKIDRIVDGIFQSIERGYRAMLRYMSERRIRFIFLILIAASAPLMLFPKLGFNFFPDIAQDAMEVKMTFPAGTINAEMKHITEQFIEDIRDILPPLESTVIEVVGGGAETGFSGKSRYMTTIEFSFIDPMEPNEFQTISNNILEQSKNYVYPINVIGFITTSGGGNRGQQGVQILQVNSSDRNKLKQAADSFSNTIRQMDGIKNVSTNLPSSDMAVSIAVDRERANAYGLTIKEVSDELSLAVKANNAGQYIQGAREYSIVMKLRDEDRKRVDLFDQLYIRTPSARLPLSNFTSNTVASTDQIITRENGINSVDVSYELKKGYNLDQAVADVRAALEKNIISQDEDIQYYFRGEFEERNKTSRIMLLIFLFAVLFVFGTMAGMFESFADPFIIIFAIPLTFSGVVLVYYLTKNSLSAFTMAGLVILVGISVNHGIVLVDYINTLRKRGRGLVDAIIEGGGTRLQPILMTTLTTMGGMAPLAFTNKYGTELMKPLALTMFGGLGTSALLSLFFIPLLYGGFHSLKERLGRKRRERLFQRKEVHEQEILNSQAMEQGDI